MLLLIRSPGIDGQVGADEKAMAEVGGPVGIEAVAARMRTGTARLAARLWQRPAGWAAPPGPVAGPLPDLEYRAWAGYYRRKWPQVLVAFVGLLRMGSGMNWYRTLRGAWLVLRAVQLWAPYPDNDPDGARAYMRRFYALVRLSYGEPASPAEAAKLEVDWWRAHRQAQYSITPGGAGDELVESVTRHYCYLFSEPEAAVRPAAAHRAHAMSLSDQWVREGCLPGSPLLPLVRAALVRAYDALLVAVHH